MEFIPQDKNGPVLLVPKIWRDGRGYFMETFRQNEFSQHCGNHDFVQDNQSKSIGPVLRGIHYQLKKPQGKLVRVISGRVFDVAIDLRRSSPFFGKVYSFVLDNVENHMLWVPPGFGHGFRALSEESEFVYKCTDYYNPGDEHTLLWNDPELAIPWPSGIPLLSEKDLKGKALADCEVYP